MNTYAEEDELRALMPDAIIIATGGWPEPPQFEGAELTVSSWDVLAGAARLSGEVMLFDEVGDHPALVCADVMARAGCKVAHVTPDLATAHDLGPTNSAVVLRDLATQGVSFTCFQELVSVANAGNRKEVTLRHVLTGETTLHSVDHLVIEHGSVPMDGLYHALKAGSRNFGQLDQRAMIAGTSPFETRNPEGTYMLARLGDAVANRNMHAALYDALRVCKDL
jgi:pyruvate/2-oxoglutarate dehydrogenase complex dihydrolipoamide dehydrogenase (E3) component